MASPDPFYDLKFNRDVNKIREIVQKLNKHEFLFAERKETHPDERSIWLNTLYRAEKKCIKEEYQELSQLAKNLKESIEDVIECIQELNESRRALVNGGTGIYEISSGEEADLY